MLLEVRGQLSSQFSTPIRVLHLKLQSCLCLLGHLWPEEVLLFFFFSDRESEKRLTFAFCTQQRFTLKT